MGEITSMSQGHIGPTLNGIKPQIMRKDAHIISQAYYTYWVKGITPQLSLRWGLYELQSRVVMGLTLLEKKGPTFVVVVEGCRCLNM